MLPAMIRFAATYVLMISCGKYRTYFALASGALFVITGRLLNVYRLFNIP